MADFEEKNGGFKIRGFRILNLDIPRFFWVDFSRHSQIRVVTIYPEIGHMKEYFLPLLHSVHNSDRSAILFSRTSLYRIRMTIPALGHAMSSFSRTKIYFSKNNKKDISNIFAFWILPYIHNIYWSVDCFFSVWLHPWYHNRFGILARDISSIISLCLNHGLPGFHSFV